MCDDKRMSYEETLDATKEELFDENDETFKDAKKLVIGDFDELPEDDEALDEMNFDDIFSEEADGEDE